MPCIVSPLLTTLSYCLTPIGLQTIRKKPTKCIIFTLITMNKADCTGLLMIVTLSDSFAKIQFPWSFYNSSKGYIYPPKVLTVPSAVQSPGQMVKRYNMSVFWYLSKTSYNMAGNILFMKNNQTSHKFTVSGTVFVTMN